MLSFALEKDAWFYLADRFDRAEIVGEFARAKIDDLGVAGVVYYALALCPAISLFRAFEAITEPMQTVMSRRIRECAEWGTYWRCSAMLFPTTLDGARSRAAICRRLALQCEEATA